MLEWLRFIIVAVLMLSGAAILLSGVVGVYRFKYVLNRMHSAAMGDTMGLFLIILGLMVASGFAFTTLKLLLVIVMLWLTSPVASHLITRLEVATNSSLSKEMEVRMKGAPQEEVEK